MATRALCLLYRGVRWRILPGLPEGSGGGSGGSGQRTAPLTHPPPHPTTPSPDAGGAFWYLSVSLGPRLRVPAGQIWGVEGSFDGAFRGDGGGHVDGARDALVMANGTDRSKAVPVCSKKADSGEKCLFTRTSPAKCLLHSLPHQRDAAFARFSGCDVSWIRTFHIQTAAEISFSLSSPSKADGNNIRRNQCYFNILPLIILPHNLLHPLNQD